MSPRYESPEFSEELKRRLNSNSVYREKAKGITWKILIIVNEIPFAILSSYLDGELVERRHVPIGETEEARKKADFIVEVPTYELSVEMATGRKPLESLFMSRMVKVEGSIFKALQYRSALEATAQTTAELANSSSIPTKEEFITTLKERRLL